MNYSVQILPRAVKELDSLPEHEYDRIAIAIEALARDPRPAGSKKLRGREGWRVRVGNYRVLYWIDDEQRRVVVVNVGHRKEIYR